MDKNELSNIHILTGFQLIFKNENNFFNPFCGKLNDHSNENIVVRLKKKKKLNV